MTNYYELSNDLQPTYNQHYTTAHTHLVLVLIMLSWLPLLPLLLIHHILMWYHCFLIMVGCCELDGTGAKYFYIKSPNKCTYKNWIVGLFRILCECISRVFDVSMNIRFFMSKFVRGFHNFILRIVLLLNY